MHYKLDPIELDKITISGYLTYLTLGRLFAKGSWVTTTYELGRYQKLPETEQNDEEGKDQLTARI